MLVNYKIERMYKLGILLPLEIFSSTLHLTRQPEGPSMACNGAYSVAVLYLLGTKQLSLNLTPEPQNREKPSQQVKRIVSNKIFI